MTKSEVQLEGGNFSFSGRREGGDKVALLPCWGNLVNFGTHFWYTISVGLHSSVLGRLMSLECNKFKMVFRFKMVVFNSHDMMEMN